MDENHQDKTGSKQIATEDKLWLPPLSHRDQEKLKRFQKKSFAERMGVAGKTPWDLIQLLIIPLVLLVIGSLFSYQQNQTSLQVSERQHQTDLQLSQQQHDIDVQIAQDQQRETTLKTYMDNMSDLLLNQKLQESKPNDEVRVVARVRTLIALQQLDAKRKGLLLQFLYEAKLIDGKGENVVISLWLANLSGASLNNTSLSGANLSETNLSYAELQDVNLSGADLSGANLQNIKLRYIDLSKADLSHADLSLADLGGNESWTDLRGANLSYANLSGIDFHSVDLSGANLSGAIMPEGWLDSVPDLNLQGTIMPDGSIHP